MLNCNSHSSIANFMNIFSQLLKLSYFQASRPKRRQIAARRRPRACPSATSLLTHYLNLSGCATSSRTLSIWAWCAICRCWTACQTRTLLNSRRTRKYSNWILVWTWATCAWYTWMTRRRPFLWRLADQHVPICTKNLVRRQSGC